MATTLTTSSCCSSYSPSSPFFNQKSSSKRILSCFFSLPCSSSRFGCLKLSCSVTSSTSFCKAERRSRARVSIDSSAVVEEEKENMVAEEINKEEEEVTVLEPKKVPRPCELYVCNLPRSCDIAELAEMFKPFGNVLAVEVSRNAETGISRGCGYITMGSINSAKVAIAALDKSDVGGREMRVRFAVDMNPTATKNPTTLNTSPKKNIIYESPHKLYVGNLDWSVKPGDLRDLFTQFGTVVSAKVLHDRRAGKNRVFGFLSFSTAAERDASKSLDGTEFHGRPLVVREGLERTES